MRTDNPVLVEQSKHMSDDAAMVFFGLGFITGLLFEVAAAILIVRKFFR